MNRLHAVTGIIFSDFMPTDYLKLCINFNSAKEYNGIRDKLRNIK